MKKFNKLVKVMVTVLAITIAFGLTSTNAFAAKKKSLTLFKGEKVEYTIFIGGALKSVKSSNKSVITAKKKSGKAALTAKKAGKATLTFKAERGTQVYNVTVKKNPIKLSYTTMNKGIVVKAENTSNKAFSSVTVNATFYDAAGNPVTENTGTVRHVGPKQKGYTFINVYKSDIDLSKTKISAPVSGWSRGYESKYKGYGKKVKSKIKVESDKYMLNASTKYKGKGGIYVAADIAFLDDAGNTVSIYTPSMYLWKNKKVDTTVGISLPYGATSYKVLNKRAYLDY